LKAMPCAFLGSKLPNPDFVGACRNRRLARDTASESRPFLNGARPAGDARASRVR
jgi:hypothetical protein